MNYYFTHCFILIRYFTNFFINLNFFFIWIYFSIWFEKRYKYVFKAINLCCVCVGGYLMNVYFCLYRTYLMKTRFLEQNNHWNLFGQVDNSKLILCSRKQMLNMVIFFCIPETLICIFDTSFMTFVNSQH